MAYVLSSTTVNLEAYLTQYGREQYILGDDNDIFVKYFNLADDDTNYFLAFNNIILDNGKIPDLTGDQNGCIRSIANGITLNYPIKVSKNKKGDIIREYCQPPFTLVQEISNGDGTSSLNFIENSINCGFVFRSNVFSRTFTKQNCGVGGIGQDFVVETTQGQFTGTTQNDADQKALDFINISGQTIANQLGVCRFGNLRQERSGLVNQNCDNPRPYTAVAEANTIFSNISVEDANNKALIFLQTNGQNIANQFGECRQIIAFATSPLISYGTIPPFNPNTSNLLFYTLQFLPSGNGSRYVNEVIYNTDSFNNIVQPPTIILSDIQQIVIGRTYPFKITINTNINSNNKFITPNQLVMLIENQSNRYNIDINNINLNQQNFVLNEFNRNVISAPPPRKTTITYTNNTPKLENIINRIEINGSILINMPINFTDRVSVYLALDIRSASPVYN